MRRLSLGRHLSRGLLLTVFAAFVLLPLAHAVSDGVCCADDGLPSVVAKNLARGLGYSCTVQVGRPHFALRPFDESLTTGPTVVLPASLVMMLVGNRYWVPGVTFVTCWALLMVAAFRALEGLAAPGSVRLASIAFLVAAFAVTPFHFEQWYAMLGEVPAFLFVVLAAFVWARRPSSALRVLAASALLSLAMLTKLMALLYYGAYLIVLCSALFASRRLFTRQALRTLAASGGGFLLPLGAFQAWKLAALGPAAYLGRLGDLIAKVRHEGVRSGVAADLALRVGTNCRTLFERLGVSIPVLLILSIGAFLLILRSRRSHLTAAAAFLLSGFVVNVAWWLLLSPGWVRYILVGVLVALVLLSLTLIVERTLPRRLALLAALAVMLIPNLGRWSFPVESARPNGWFRPSPATANALKVVSVLDGQLAGRKLTGQWWATVVDLEYLSAGTGRFERYDPSVALEPGRERLIAVNTRFLRKDDEAFNQLMQSCQPPLLDLPPYVVLQCPAEAVR